MKTPETSRLFEKRTDPKTGVEHYLLTHKITRHQQGFYFVNDSMTEDGRYLWFYVARLPGAPKLLGVIDFEKDDMWFMEDTTDSGAYIDTKTGDAYFMSGATLYRRSPEKDAVSVAIGTVPPPPSIDPNAEGEVPVWMGKGARGPAVRFCATHLTRTPDGKEFFIDVVAGVNECYSGTMEIETGKWTTWGSHELHMNHGQVNPQNGDLAMCACDWWTRLTDGKVFGIPSDENGNYLRLWTVTRDGKWTNYPPRGGFATHEYWSLDGKKIYYNNLEGIQRINLETGEHICVHPCRAWHSFATADEKYCVYDAKHTSEEEFWRGGPTRVAFVNTETGKEIDIASYLPPSATREKQSGFHPDPHPRFVGNEKYVVYTTSEEGGLDIALASVEHLKEMCK